MNNSCCVSDSSRLHMQRYDIRQGRFAHFGPRWFTFVLFGSLWFKMVLFRLCHIWWLLASYMMIFYVIYDTRQRHIWYLPASYMMHSHAMLSVGWGPICLLQAHPICRYLKPSFLVLLHSRGVGGFYATISARNSYHLGEWGWLKLHSQRVVEC